MPMRMHMKENGVTIWCDHLESGNSRQGVGVNIN